MSKKFLQFHNLNERHPGVSFGVATAYSEAARVCLDRHHTSPHDFELTDIEGKCLAEVSWHPADNRTRASWANHDDATEQGAYGLALAAIETTRGLVAIGRAETRTGADYYLALRSTLFEDFEAAYRLEVSGTDAGDTVVIKSRLRQKIEQARRGNSNLPAIATIVGFAANKIESSDVDKT